MAWNNGALYGGTPNVSARTFTLDITGVDPDTIGLRVDKSDNDHGWLGDAVIPYEINS